MWLILKKLSQQCHVIGKKIANLVNFSRKSQSIVKGCIEFAALLALIGVRFSTSLRYIELPCELITPPILHEMANKVNTTNSYRLSRVFVRI